MRGGWEVGDGWDLDDIRRRLVAERHPSGGTRQAPAVSKRADERHCLLDAVCTGSRSVTDVVLGTI